MIFIHPAGNERHQRHPKQKEQIRLQYPAVDLFGCGDQLMMVDPKYGHVHKAEDIAEKYGQHRQQ
jgi:hypothetical protein